MYSLSSSPTFSFSFSTLLLLFVLLHLTSSAPTQTAEPGPSDPSYNSSSSSSSNNNNNNNKPDPHQPPCGACLTPSEIIPLSTRWLAVFATDGLADLPNIATSKIQYWNEEFTYPGAPYPYANNRSQLRELIAWSADAWTTCNDIRFEIVSAWNSCDRIAVRWRQRGVVSGEDEYAAAKAGTPVLFSGIDLLTIDLGNRMVSNAETSSDRLNYYAAVGIDPFRH